MRSLILCALLLSATLTVAQESNPTTTENPENQTVSETIQILSDLVSTRGCAKAQVCFALYNDENEVSEKYYRLQKTFVQSVLAVISNDDRARVAALQYGIIADVVSVLVEVSEKFSTLIDQATVRDNNGTSISAPIVVCDAIFADSSSEVGTMLLFTNGRKNFGGDPRRSSEIFRNRGGKMFGVGVGDVDREALEEIVGDSSKVEELHWYNDISLILTRFIHSLCAE